MLGVISTMTKSIILIVVIGVMSFKYTDFNSSNIFFSIILPIVDFFSLVSMALWFVILFHRRGISQTVSSGGGDTGGIDGGGGD